jgi:galactoside O-acetyltransferase
MYDISKLAKHGEDVYIADNVVIKNPSTSVIGSHVAIDDYFYCTPSIKIGDYCHISSHVSIVGGAQANFRMGNFSHLAAGARLVVLGDENLGAGLVSPVIPKIYRDRIVGGYIFVMDFVSILTNAVVSPGVTMGIGSVLAANSFAKQDIPEWEVWGGSPARFLKKRDKGVMLEFARELGYGY